MNMFKTIPAGIPVWTIEKGKPTIPPPIIVDKYANAA